MRTALSKAPLVVASLLTLLAGACAAQPVAQSTDKAPSTPAAPSTPTSSSGVNLPEVRGTWVTTTANDAISSPANTAKTMQALREIGLNTVYVETWKNGYTQFPSETLKRTIGVDRRPALMKQDPSDTPDKISSEGRDLLEETLIEAHRNGLIYVAWFEYGFMAAHKDTMNHLREKYPQWLSRDIKGSEVAPNGFVWMNPLHPEPRKFLIDLVVEAAEKYDLDGVQLDDRIVWPYINMGYDDYTKQVYAKENAGKQPPSDHKDKGWMRWRADKVNEYGKMFTQSVRSRVPGVTISLSPAVYPWCFENYLLEWPLWGAWTQKDAIDVSGNEKASKTAPHWDEFIPQNYRYNFEAFERTWFDQVRHIDEMGKGRRKDLIAGIMTTGSEPKPVAWEDVKKAVELTRATNCGGHVWWFSKGTLEIYPQQTKELYQGWVPNPRYPSDWREPSTKLTVAKDQSGAGKDEKRWEVSTVKPGRYRVIVHDGTKWSYLTSQVWDIGDAAVKSGFGVSVPDKFTQVELLRDRRADRKGLADAR